jgi:hypothetical protein
MIEIDTIIKDLIQSDKLHFEPDPSIELRLKNHLQMKISSSPTKQNMLLPFFTGFLSSKLIGLKLSIMVALIIGFAGLRQINHQENKTFATDTCNVNSISDSIGYMEVMDSISFN